MAIRAVRLDHTTIYESKMDADRGTPQATRWHLRPLPSRLYAQIRDKTMQYDQTLELSNDDAADSKDAAPREVVSRMRTSAYESALEMVRHGLIKIENFLDHDGNEVAFNTQRIRVNGKFMDVVASDVLDQIDIDIVLELANELRGMSTLTEEEGKNSDR